jgi:hypothetical protein
MIATEPSTTSATGVELCFAPELVEEVVFRRMAADEAAPTPDSLRWRIEHDHTYLLRDPAAREAAFRQLSIAWFERMSLGTPVREALAVCPCLRAGLPRVDVRRALTRRAEGSELFADTDQGGSTRFVGLALGITVERFLDRSALRELTLREFSYAEDMLDPAFAYRPALPDTVGPDVAQRELVRDRLRVLWEARIEARLRRLLERDADPHEPPARFLSAFRGIDPALAHEIYAGSASGQLSTFDALLEACVGRPQG